SHFPFQAPDVRRAARSRRGRRPPPFPSLSPHTKCCGGAQSSTQHLAAVKEKAVHRHPPVIHQWLLDEFRRWRSAATPQSTGRSMTSCYLATGNALPRSLHGRRSVLVRRVLAAVLLFLLAVTTSRGDAAEPATATAPAREVLMQRAITVDEAVA